jgi:hypothetical protein
LRVDLDILKQIITKRISCTVSQDTRTSTNFPIYRVLDRLTIVLNYNGAAHATRPQSFRDQPIGLRQFGYPLAV